MRLIFSILSLIVLLSVFDLKAQIVFSNGTGGGAWNEASTWLGGTVPGINHDVIIAGTDSVYTESAVIANNLTILSSGRFATAIDTVGVVNTLTIEADAYYYNRSDDPTLPGSDLIIDPQSYVVHSGSGTVGGEGNAEFGNLIIRRIEGCVPGTSLLIQGDLIIDNFAANVVFRGSRPQTGSQTHTVLGDVHILKGTLSCIDVGDPSMYCEWNIMGDVYITDKEEPYLESRMGPFSSANAAGLGVINVGGNIIVDGGRLQGGTSSSPGLGTGIINIGGDLIMNSSSSVVTNTHGSISVNFTGSGTQTVDLDINFNMSTALYDTVKSGSSVVFDFDTTRWNSSVGGDFVVEGALEVKGNSRISGAGNFILNADAGLKIGSAAGITTDTVGNIQVAGTRSFSADAEYEYKGTSAQVTGDALPAEVKVLAVNNPEGLTINSDYTVKSDLNIINGDLDLNGHTITLSENGTLTESSGNTVKGAGKITVTTNAGVPSLLNIGGLGASITSAVDIGSTTVERYHSAASGFDNEGILRYYSISPSVNTNLNATIRIYYDESELNGLNEANLFIAKSPDGSDNSWIKIGGTVNTAENYVEASAVSDLSFWTLTSSDNPITSIEEISAEYIPSVYALHQNFPNPFNPETKIRFDIPESGIVNLSVYNLLGEKVAVLLNEELNAGVYEHNFNMDNYSSGIYLYKLSAGGKSFSKKMILMK